MSPIGAEAHGNMGKDPAIRAGLAGKLAEWLVFAAIAALFSVICLRYFGDGYVDDSYIFFRYAEHLANGQGLSWNPGEGALEGFSSLLWVALIALASRFGPADVAAIARPLGIVLTVLAILAAWRFARHLLERSPPRSALLVPAALALSPIVARHAINGMETSLAMLAFAGLPWLWTRDRGGSWVFPVGLGVATTLAFLTRPDAVAFAVLGSAFVLVFPGRSGDPRRGRRLIAYAMTLVALMAAILAWKLWYFGSIVPLPAYMKLSVLRPRESGLFTRLQANAVLGFVTYAAVPLLAGAAAIAAGARLRAAAWWATLVAGGGYFAYLLTIVPAVNFAHRFFVPVFVPLVAVAYAVAAEAWRSLDRRGPRGIGGLIATAAAVWLLVTHNTGLYHPVRETAVGDRSDPLGALGRALSAIHGLSIAYSEAGQLPYFSGARFFDVAGLNDRGVARLRFGGNAVADFRARLMEIGVPDIYIEPPIEYASYAALARHPQLAERYEPWSWNALQIGVLRDSPRRTEIVAALAEIRARPPSGAEPGATPG